jgi:hypothetical protein
LNKRKPHKIIETLQSYFFEIQILMWNFGIFVLLCLIENQQTERQSCKLYLSVWRFFVVVTAYCGTGWQNRWCERGAVQKNTDTFRIILVYDCVNLSCAQKNFCF